MVSASVGDGSAGTYSFFADADVRNAPTVRDTTPVELGLQFTSSSAGILTAVRFLKARGDSGEHRVSVWSGDGRKLATATSKRESRAGWQKVSLPSPVQIDPGKQYVVSYRTSRHRTTPNYFDRLIKAGPLSTSGPGVYTYRDGSFPTETRDLSNYWVDVVFKAAAGGPAPSPSMSQTAEPTATALPTATATATQSPTATATPSPTPVPTLSGDPGLGLPRVAWEGGPSYYARFPISQGAGWTNPLFFPIGVWYESVLSQADIDKDRGAGLNTYVELTSNSDLGLIRSNRMSAMPSAPLRNYGGETVGWLINDEVDMWGGAGTGTWAGKLPEQGFPCVSGRYDCGYDAMRRLSAALPAGDGRMRYANYGKGVMFWQSDSDASKFVNDYTTVVSNDIYWYTDPNVCSSSSEGPSLGVTATTCRRAANYGLTMDKMRRLDGMDGSRQPIYAFIEVGHPFTQNSAPTITGDQIAGAVMNSLIHEARGIIYFNHNFGGSCISQHVLRDSCGAAVRPVVTETNGRIAYLAPVLNTQSYDWRFNSNLDTMLKAYGGSYYVFAMPGRTGGTGDQQLTLPTGLAGAQAEVLFEGRTVSTVGGVIHDSFARESSYHIYKITP
jgi:hypothetical protein